MYDGPTIQLGKRQLHTIDEGWHTDMKSRLFNKVGIMRHFQGPGSHKPPRHAEFRHRSVVPTGKMIEDFWGKKIWSYMEERLAVRMAKRETKTRKLVNAFWGRDLALCRAVVFADGTPQSQASPYRGDAWDCWWPVLATYANETCTTLVAFFQAQALSDSRPYETHPSRVVFIPAPPTEPPATASHQAGGPMWFANHTTVTIEEMSDSDAQSDKSYLFSDNQSDKSYLFSDNSDESWNSCGRPRKRRWGNKNNQ